MSGPRRVVTGNSEGRSVFLSDGCPPAFHAFAGVPGMTSTVVWATAQIPAYLGAAAEGAPAGIDALPQPGETRFLIIRFPPDAVFASEAFDPGLMLEEQAAHLPGLAECLAQGTDGMHRTPTIDYGIVIQGEIDLELDDGATRHLAQGDVVVQGATRHAWRNPGACDAVMGFVLIGAVPAG